MLKVALLPNLPEQPTVFPLFTRSDAVFEKTAAPHLLDEVTRYIDQLRPREGSQYVLVSAMGSSEYWGQNVNGDIWPEDALLHVPADWRGVPVYDRTRAESWPYGYPTFYRAHPYAHHVNKDPSRAFGEVELAAWNPRMHRVELVVRIDRQKCVEFGGVSVWDKIHNGEFPDTSMGAKVPFDLCSIHTDWPLYWKAVNTFDSRRHKYPGEAVLEFHKELKKRNGTGIPGLAITRREYCEDTLRRMNHVLPDGRKIGVVNTYPAFFDISFVFIGADRTAKTMLKIAYEGTRLYTFGSAERAEQMGYVEEDQVKTAAPVKQAKIKAGEIKKHTPPQWAPQAVQRLTGSERDIPDELIDRLAHSGPEKALSTTAGLGMVLKPREFQRLMLIGTGRRDLADRLDHRREVFGRTSESIPMPMSLGHFSPLLAQLLSPMIEERSAFGPHIEKRITIIVLNPSRRNSTSSSLGSNELRKMSAAYNGYREGLMNLVAQAAETNLNGDLLKLASDVDIFTPLSVSYLIESYWDHIN